LRALEKIKVLDLTRLAPGPFCTMILADMGAEVLRIQEPGSPGGRRAQQAGEAGIDMPAVVLAADSPYSSHQRNKKSLALNLKMEESKEIFYQLTKEADVLVEEMRPGVTRRLGIDYETLKAINPRLVYCSITGYGQSGPYRERAGHDINYISLAGALGLIGEKGQKPAIPLNVIGDLSGGSLYAVIGILTALLAREKTGRGQYVDISMTDSVVSLLSFFFAEYFENGNIARRGQHSLNGKMPYYNVYLTKDDKYITIGCIEPWFYANLCRVLGREDLVPYQNAAEEKQQEIFRVFTEIFRRKTRDEWEKELNQLDLCAGKVLDLDELPDEPQLRERLMFIELDHPDKGKVRQVGIPIKLSDTPGEVTLFPPHLGEHTDEILKQLGYMDDEIARLRRKGCIK
jgi:crotonobetainyl-CoA:carnitine CoA-transferase CaiB-like acyl-CoA transferase